MRVLATTAYTIFITFIASAALAQSNSPCSAVDVLQKDGSTKPFANIYCYSNPVINYNPGDSLNNYYGSIVATTSDDSTTLQGRKSDIVSFFHDLFIKDNFTAQVSVVPEIMNGITETVLPERPLFMISQAGGLSNVGGDSSPLQNAQLAPWFSINSTTSKVKLTFKVSVSNKTNINVSTAFKSASDAASKFNLSGWLLSSLGQLAVQNVANTVQSDLSDFYSSSITSSSSVTLDYNSLGSAPNTQATLQVNFMNGNKLAGSYTVQIGLVARPSLIVDATRLSNGRKVPAIDNPMQAPAVGHWGDRIFIADGKTLTTALTADGVPRNLSALKAKAADPLPSLSDSIDSACDDLDAALRGGKYFWLDDTDADLILYDQLNSSNAFSKAPHGDCIQRKELIWRDVYGLPVPIMNGALTMTKEDMTKGLNTFSGAWKTPAMDVRVALLKQAAADQVSVTESDAVPAMHFPELDAAHVSSGIPDGPIKVAPSVLAAQTLSCLGTYTPLPDGQSMTALALFNGDNTSYILTFQFDNSSGWSTKAGPPVQVIQIDVAKAGDLKKAQPGHCG